MDESHSPEMGTVWLIGLLDTDEHIGQKWHFNELFTVVSAARRPLVASRRLADPEPRFPSAQGPARFIGWQIRLPWRQLISRVMRTPPAARRLVVSSPYRNIRGWGQNGGAAWWLRRSNGSASFLCSSVTDGNLCSSADTSLPALGTSCF